MAGVQKGHKVTVHYSGTFEDGTVFDSSAGREPLAFTVGEGAVIAGFENGVLGMAVGEKKVVVIPASEAYGEHNSELVTDVDRKRFPENIELELGQQLQVQLDNGHQAIVMVVDINDTSVTLDANHPLAGRELTFDIELVSCG